MDIEYKGANCIVITSKKDTFVTDPNISTVGLKDQGYNATAQLLTHQRFMAPASSETVVINGPGEYEVRNCSIVGVAAQSYIESPDLPPSATIFCLKLDDITVAIIGHVASKLSEAQLEALGVVDVLVLPVGNHGYTLDTQAAVDVVRATDPKVVIPTHYAAEGVNYEVPQDTADGFIKELGAASETVTKLKLKGGQLPDKLTVFIVELTK